MQKYVVVHKSVDLDAVTSVWMVRKFFPGFEAAEVLFVNAGSTYEGMDPDSNPHYIHVDTGFGKYDHHQTPEFTCASQKVFEEIEKRNLTKPHMIEGLRRIAAFVTEVDHFREVYYPNPTSDVYTFSLVELIEGLKHTLRDDLHVVDIAAKLLDASLQLITNKIRAEDVLSEGYTFTSAYGKSLAIESKNEEVVKIALKEGYQLVVRKDPDKGHIRIKTFPDPKHDLTPVYDEIVKKDGVGSWFLHVSKKMLLNGSSKNPALKPSPLALNEVVAIIQEVA